MKNELQDKLVEILGGIQGAVSKGSDFVLTQLPDVAQQYVTFGRVWALIVIAGSLVGLAFSGLLIRKGVRVAKDSKWGEETPWFAFGGMGVMASVGACGLGTYDACLVWFAPKVWLLIEIAKLVRH